MVGIKVLVADDSSVNRRAASIMLEELGHQVMVVRNGLEAVAATARNCYDMILMDVQMPEMDGIEAAAAIRAQESGQGKHTPIVAMTATVAVGDRERYLKAGMNGYVSKPLTLSSLSEALLLGAQGYPDPIRFSGKADAFDREEFLGRIGHDDALLGEVIELFREDAPPRMTELKVALRQGNFSALEKAAHALKGMAKNFSAHAAFKAARNVEMKARSNEWKDMLELVAKLENEFYFLNECLFQMVKGVA